MRALVTGGAGFIGHHLVAALLRRGLDVTVLDDLSLGRPERLPETVRLVVGDVRDRAALADSLLDVTHVYHLAALVSVRESVAGFRRDAEVNLMGTLCLLEAMRGRSIGKAVFASSMAVYSDSVSGRPLHERDETNPASPYGVAKLAAEAYWQMLCPDLGVEGTVLRLFNTYGRGQTPSPYVGVISHFAQQILRGESPSVFGDGEQRRDFVHVDDVVAAATAVLDVNVAGRTFNVGTGIATTVNEVARALLALIGSDLEPRYVAARPGELRCAVADIGEARAILGYDPVHRTLDLAAVVDSMRGR